MSEWRPTPVSQLPSWAGAKRVGLDCETYDPQLKKLGPGVRRDGRVIGISFAIEDGPSFYLPIGHYSDNLDPTSVWAYLKEQADQFTGIIVGANLQYDLDYLAHNGIWFHKAKWFRDVQVAEPLIDELQDSYSLQAIAERHGLPGKDERLLREAAKAWKVDPKHDMSLLPARFVGPYAIWDAELPLKLLRRQERIIEEQGLWKIYNLESQVLPVLVKMRRRGVKVDFDKLEQVEKWAISEAKKALKFVWQETGRNIKWDEVWKAAALAPALEDIGVTLERTKTGKPSIDKELLGRIDHPVAKALERARKMNKVVTTFANSVREYETNGRIHCTFNQLRTSHDSEEGDAGARYGRFSSSDPNMQQQPARDPEIGPLWRSIYIPDGDGLWACKDYSQQEPRWLVHFAELCGLPRAAEAAERYRTDPTTDNHSMMAEMCGIERKPAKEIFLGKCYGMGGAKLCRALGLPTEWIHSTRLNKMIEIAGPEGQAIIDKFDKELPFVRLLAKLCEEKAAQRGYITTVLGRRCRFPKKQDGSYDWTHKALNRLIQGSSADQTKAAVVQLDAESYEPQLLVHDEIDSTVSSVKEAEQMAEIMRHCVKANVPFRVDVEIGPNWGEADVLRESNAVDRQSFQGGVVGQSLESTNPGRRRR